MAAAMKRNSSIGKSVFAVLVMLGMVGDGRAEAQAAIDVHMNLAGASNTKCNALPGVICYWQQAQSNFVRKIALTNSAVNGSTASGFDLDFIHRVRPYYDKRFKYNILTVQLGGNDILSDAKGDATFGHLKSIAAKWKALGKGTFVVVATVPRFGYSTGQLLEADRLNPLILSEPSFDATFDIASIRNLDQGDACPPSHLSPDCSHLTTEGNSLVAPLFAGAVNSVLSSEYGRSRKATSGLAR